MCISQRFFGHMIPPRKGEVVTCDISKEAHSSITDGDVPTIIAYMYFMSVSLDSLPRPWDLSSPHRNIPLAMLLASLPSSQGLLQRECKSQWICIASQRCFSAMHFALHKSLGLVPYEAPEIAGFISWIAKAYRIAGLHRAMWQT